MGEDGSAHLGVGQRQPAVGGQQVLGQGDGVAPA